MQLRAYQPADCAEMAELFYQTVHCVNARDYTAEQLNVWATGKVDLQAWNRSFLVHKTIVAVEDGRIVGFGDIDDTGYLDRLYVHKDHQGQGIASALCDRLEGFADGMRLTVHASITAKPFFGCRGYRVVRAQTVVLDGVPLTNYAMEK